MLAAGFQLTANDYIAGEKDWVYGVRYHGKALEPGAKIPIGAAVTLVVGGDIAVVDSLSTDSVALETPQAAPVSEEESWF